MLSFPSQTEILCIIAGFAVVCGLIGGVIGYWIAPAAQPVPALAPAPQVLIQYTCPVQPQ